VRGAAGHQRNLGGIKVVLAGMRTHTGAEGVQEQGCAALGILCRLEANRAKVAALGGVEVVIAGIEAHAGDEDVQAMGCKALRVLCFNAGIVKRMKALGTVREVVERAKVAAKPARESPSTGVPYLQENAPP